MSCMAASFSAYNAHFFHAESILIFGMHNTIEHFINVLKAINTAKSNEERLDINKTQVDPGFPERGFICIKVWGFALLILSHFS